MTKWVALSHAYGCAEDIPELLDALSPDEDDEASNEAWDELWSRVCHQGSVYSASAAVLPWLRLLAQRWEPAARVAPLRLAGAIVSSRDPSPDFDIAPFRADIDALARIAVESLTATLPLQDDFLFMLQAAVALQGHSLWGRQLDRLADGALFGLCPSCDAELVIAIGARDGEVRRNGVPRAERRPGNPIQPADPGTLTDIGRLMHEFAQKASQHQVALALRHVFGHATCPACDQRFSIAEAVASADA